MDSPAAHRNASLMGLSQGNPALLRKTKRSGIAADEMTLLRTAPEAVLLYAEDKTRFEKTRKTRSLSGPVRQVWGLHRATWRGRAADGSVLQ